MPLVDPTLIAIPPSPDMDNHDPHASMMDDSASSEGVSTPGEDYDRTLGAPLSINIPKQFHYPPIGTPFVTSSSSLYEYPFPTVPSRPPLSTASSSSSITSMPGPPSAAVMDKHLPKLFARLTSRSPTHRRAASATSLPVIPIPPRLRKLSGGHISQPGRSDLSVPRARSPKSADSLSHGLTHEAGGFALRKAGADRTPDWTMSPRQLGPALSSPPRSCIDTQPHIPPFLVDPDDEIRSYLGEPTRGVEITRLDGF